MSRRGSGQERDWTDGGGSARPRYMAVRAPSPPLPNGHQRCGHTQTSLSMLPAGKREAKGARRRTLWWAVLMVCTFVLACVVAASSVAALAWVLWRLAVAGG